MTELQPDMTTDMNETSIIPANPQGEQGAFGGGTTNKVTDSEGANTSRFQALGQAADVYDYGN